MKKDKRSHNWAKGQPHHSRTGRITSKKFAINNPDKVEWVRGKKGRK